MLIVKENPKSPISEAYRTLRTNIEFSDFDNDIGIMLVTSAGPCEGKSVTAANLALSVAETGKKVLLIDCDLRKPSIHKKFEISNSKGISNLLIGESQFSEIAQRYNENLYILTSGTVPPNPCEMIESQKMKIFLRDAKNDFDFIILDTPPVIVVADAQLLSAIVGGVLLVIAAGKAEIKLAQKAKELLEHAKANIIGVVLNKAELNSDKINGYQYYYTEDNNKKERRMINMKKIV